MLPYRPLPKEGTARLLLLLLLLLFILLWLDPNLSMLLLLGTLLQLLTPTNLSAYEENLRLFATKDFFKMWNAIVTIYWKN
jgi:hypothetical protein